MLFIDMSRNNSGKVMMLSKMRESNTEMFWLVLDVGVNAFIGWVICFSVFFQEKCVRFLYPFIIFQI